MKSVTHMKEFFGFKFWKTEQGKTELKIAGKFLLTFGIIFAMLFFLQSFFPIQILEEWIARVTANYLAWTGVNSAVLAQEPVLIQLENGTQIAISYLCTGLLELIVLASAILASHGISWKKRWMGVLAGILVSQVFNFARIFITIQFVLGGDLGTIDLVHGLLFRITLFGVIAGLYALWFAWAVGKIKFGKTSTIKQV